MSSPISKCSLIVAAAASILSFCTTIAVAETPVATTAARAAVQEGARLFEAKEYEAALAQFQAAYALVASPKLRYNFGLSYLAMGRKPDALEAFESFLRDTPDPPPVQKLKAAQQVQALRKELMIVSLTCNVNGAKVIIDGRLRGFTPLTEQVPLEPGEHELLVEREGSHDPSRQLVSGKAGEIVPLSVTLKQQAAREPETLAAAPVETVRTQPLIMTAAPPPAPEAKPFYTRGWFWGAVGVVALAAAAGVFLAFRPDDSPRCPPNVDSCLSP